MAQRRPGVRAGRGGVPLAMAVVGSLGLEGADGTSYPGSVVLGIPASQVEVRITNSNYQKLAQ